MIYRSHAYSEEWCDRRAVSESAGFQMGERARQFASRSGWLGSHDTGGILIDSSSTCAEFLPWDRAVSIISSQSRSLSRAFSLSAELVSSQPGLLAPLKAARSIVHGFSAWAVGSF